jgi:hypothetical protein
MNSQSPWKATFNNWPAGIPRRGIVVNSLNESTPFKSFLVRDDALLLERTNVDPLGARFILMGFDTINSVRFIDPIKESVLTTAGFLGKLSQQ